MTEIGDSSSNVDGILIDTTEINDKLLISFGGIRQGMGIPVVEFFNSLKDAKCDKIFVRDFHQMWYHKGVNKDILSIPDLEN